MFFEIIKNLSQSTNMAPFRSGYVQRMINFQWYGYYRKNYYKLLTVQTIIFILILTNCATLNWYNRTLCQSRIGVNALNACIIGFFGYKYELPRLRRKDSWFQH